MEFAGVRSKMYSVLVSGMERKMAAAGVRRNLAKRYMRHEDYKEVIYGGEEVHINQTTIQSRNHHLYTVSSDKCALSAIDSKCFILQDLISTRALGHMYNEGDQWDWDLGLPVMDLSE